MPTLAVFSREFVLDLCDGEDVVATEILYFLRLKGYGAAITPTVGHSLVDMANVDQNKLAMQALFKLREPSPLLLAPQLTPVQHGYAEQAVNALMAKLDLPEHMKNVALIIAEAAVLESRFLILDDAELEELDVSKINPILSGQGLATLQIFDRTHFYGLISGQRV